MKPNANHHNSHNCDWTNSGSEKTTKKVGTPKATIRSAAHAIRLEDGNNTDDFEEFNN